MIESPSDSGYRSIIPSTITLVGAEVMDLAEDPIEVIHLSEDLTKLMDLAEDLTKLVAVIMTINDKP